MSRLLIVSTIVDDNYNTIADNGGLDNAVSIELTKDHLSAVRAWSEIILNMEFTILNILGKRDCQADFNELGNEMHVREEYLRVDVDKTSLGSRRVLPIPECLYNRIQTEERCIPRDLFVKIRALRRESEGEPL